MDIDQSNAKQSTTTVVAEPVPEPAAPRTAGSQCTIPASALSAVRRTRIASVFVIFVHVLVSLAWILIVGDDSVWTTWSILQVIATAIACIVGRVVLGSSSRHSFSLAGILFLAGSAIDFALFVHWCNLRAKRESENQAASDDYDQPTSVFGFVIVPSALSTLGFLVATVSAFKATCNWEENDPHENQEDQNTLPV